MSIAHFDVVPASRLTANGATRLVPLDALPPLPFDHAQIVAHAVRAVRAEYAAHPDPRGLLTETFTMRELRRLHEGIRGERLLPDTFRRTMLPSLVPTGEVQRAGPGRPAELYRRATAPGDESAHG
ncbi:NrtR DNA-binding winged helix domain-containing protein [Microbacterium gubbeenense]|uniref:NrtR DNA-binding winged helix domain-containing protein n=1 Tax=Microbacterium gubbeenense TaxID=159896 RepID=UPI003F98E5FE